MNRTTEGSKGFDVVCMSFGKEKEKGQEKGIAVVEAGRRDSFIEAGSMEITAGQCKLFENEKLEMETGNIIVNFAEYKQAKYNNDNRVTKFAIEKAKREGKLVDLNEEKKRRTKRDNEQVI